jgi:hypothetical protein
LGEKGFDLLACIIVYYLFGWRHTPLGKVKALGCLAYSIAGLLDGIGVRQEDVIEQRHQSINNESFFVNLFIVVNAIVSRQV